MLVFEKFLKEPLLKFGSACARKCAGWITIDNGSVVVGSVSQKRFGRPDFEAETQFVLSFAVKRMREKTCFAPVLSGYFCIIQDRLPSKMDLVDFASASENEFENFRKEKSSGLLTVGELFIE